MATSPELVDDLLCRMLPPCHFYPSLPPFLSGPGLTLHLDQFLGGRSGLHGGFAGGDGLPAAAAGFELGRDGAANNRTAPAGLRHPPRRTGRAAFTASGSPSDELDRGREHRLFRHHRRVHTSLLRRSSLRSTPIRLPPFAMRPAFPTSDYYEGSAPRPALAAGWPTPVLAPC